MQGNEKCTCQHLSKMAFFYKIQFFLSAGPFHMYENSTCPIHTVEIIIILHTVWDVNMSLSGAIIITTAVFWWNLELPML
jgi:hypothetical protein